MKNKKNLKKIVLTIILIVLLIVIIFSVCQTTVLVTEYQEAVEEGWVKVSEVDITEAEDKDVIGYLSIPSLNNDFYIDMPIKDGTDLNTLATAIGHFEETPYQNGNVCFAGHNSGSNANGDYVGFFDSISKLNEGDLIYYNAISETYTYKVVENKTISETDLSVLENTEENTITLITCINGISNRAYRTCVVAVRVEEENI